MPSIVCVVVHPSRMVREGLASILASSPFDPACMASSMADVPSTIADAGEQVLVLIGVREGGDLVHDMGAAKASFPDAHVVVVGDANRRDLIAAALESGASSFVDENVPTSSLIKELELVVQGEPVIAVSIVKRLLRHFSSPPSEKVVAAPVVDDPPPETEGQIEEKSQLSGREAAILHGLVQGASNKVIAFQLKITEATVKVHVKAILRKIRVKNRTQAAIWALKCQGLSMGLGAEVDGSSRSKASLGYERSDTLMIDRGPTESSRERAAH
jgi:two-component system, NarL family, nitrate/nitrite response regulator NarL